MNENRPLAPEAVKKEKMVLPVSSGTNVGKLAGCIKSNWDKNHDLQIVLRFVGAGPCNQSFKAVVIVNKWLPASHTCTMEPRFAVGETLGTVLELWLSFIQY